MTKKMNNLGTNVKSFLQIQSQLRICHWQTKSYARHMAFGSTYDTLDDLIDSFVEVAMGKYGRFTLEGETNTLELKNVKDVDFKTWLKEFKSILLEMNNDLSENDSDLLNIRDEMVATINKLQYLLTLE